jgi:cysteine desulfurase
VARRVEKCNFVRAARVFVFGFVCREVLGDAAGLTLDNIGTSDIVEQRRLAVVNMADNGHYGRARMHMLNSASIMNKMLFRKGRIYADAAASTPLSPRATRELERVLGIYGNAGALHREAVEAQREIEHARETIARAIGAHADEIIFTSGGTEANNVALAHANGHVVTTAIEHLSVLEPLRHSGATLTEVGVTPEGIIDLETFSNALTPDTTLVSVQLVNSEIGTIQPIREIARQLRKRNHKVIFHCDASQSPLWMDIKVDALHVDLMTLDAQKILGPKGIGALYVRRGVVLEPLMRGGSQEKSLRAGTLNTPLICSFAVALADAQANAASNTARIAEVRDYCLREIKTLVPEVMVNGSTTARVANNLNISVPHLEAQMAVIALDALGIAASTRSACDIGGDEPSHVIKALGVPRDLAGTAIRFTFLPTFTTREASRIARALQEIVQRYKKVL